MLGVLINVGYKSRNHHCLASGSPSRRWQWWYPPGIPVEGYDDALLALDCTQLAHASLHGSAGSATLPGLTVPVRD